MAQSHKTRRGRRGRRGKVKRCVKAQYAYCKDHDCTLNVNINNWHDVSTFVSAVTIRVRMRKATLLMDVYQIAALLRSRKSR